MHSFQMDGKKVWDFAIEAFQDAVMRGLAQCRLAVKDVDFLICHQANAVLIKQCMDTVGIPMTKTHLTVEKYGNTSSASVGITLDEAIKLGKIRKGDTVVLVGFGGGLSWGSIIMECQK
jgi:3-oxoacyl-[acyl-carrier-protein] synthase-3